MAKCIINLKQHTPIIHFQGNQDGATIRATELKPKLDRFIISKLEFIDEDLFINYKKYVDILKKSIEEKSNSLYKIKVCSTIKEKIKHGTYISKNDIKEYEKKGILPVSKVSYFGDNISLNFTDLRIEIFSYDTNMSKFIGRVVPIFLVVENFGSRQNKGFGSFTDLNITEKDFKRILINHEKMLRQENYNIYEYKNIENIENQDPLKIIQSFYQNFKSGTNKPYVKSKLCMYMKKEKSICWEKRKIKKTLNEDKYKSYYCYLKDDHKSCIQDSTENEEYRFIRAMLGLAENYIFDTDDKDKKYVFTVKDSNRKIERFQSPIFFKVFNNRIYMIIRSIPEELYDREFNIIFSTKTKKSRTETETIIVDDSFMKINTPKAQDFNLDEIIENYAKEFGFTEVKEND